MTTDQITVNFEDDAVVIRIRGILHFKFSPLNLVAIQAWKIGTKSKKYVIEYTFKNCISKCEYDAEFKWRRILKLLDELPIFTPGFES